MALCVAGNYPLSTIEISIQKLARPPQIPGITGDLCQNLPRQGDDAGQTLVQLRLGDSAAGLLDGEDLLLCLLQCLGDPLAVSASPRHCNRQKIGRAHV